MSLLYKYIYRINIKKNDWVIVQQDWIRNEFIRLYGVKNVIVARPTTHEQINIDATTTNGEKKDRKYTFIFASYPRVFKNFDVILAADKILEEKGVDGYEVILTLDGSENAYANDLKKEYTNLRNIKWTGLLDRNVLLNLYGETDCMIFPSKLETWGLPISEYKETKKPMLLADLPYAHETIGTYEGVAFFDAYNPEDLADKMVAIMDGTLKLENTVEQKREPYCSSWEELLMRIM